MTVLLLETATEKAVVALFSNEALEKKIEIDGKSQLSENLLSSINSMFKDQNEINELECIIVGTGPGSYTGIRTGASVAKALSFAKKIPLVGICGLKGFIPIHPKKGLRFLAAVDAKIGGIYCVEGECLNAQNDVAFGKEKLLSLEEFQEKLKKTPLVITPHAKMIEKRLIDCGSLKEIEFIERGVSLELLFKEGKGKLERAEYSTDGSLELSYLRKTQAEIEKDAKNR